MVRSTRQSVKITRKTCAHRLRPKQQQPPPWPLPLSTLPYVFFILANNTNLQDPPFSLEENGSGKRLATHLEKVSLKYSSFSPSAGSYQLIVTFISTHTDNMTLHEISDICFSNMDMMISCRPSPPSLRDKKAATFYSLWISSLLLLLLFLLLSITITTFEKLSTGHFSFNFNFNAVLSVYKCWNQSSWSHSCCCCCCCLFSKEAAAFVLQNANPESFTGDIAMQIILHLLLLHKNQKNKKKNKGIMAWWLFFFLLCCCCCCCFFFFFFFLIMASSNQQQQ